MLQSNMHSDSDPVLGVWPLLPGKHGATRRQAQKVREHKPTPVTMQHQRLDADVVRGEVRRPYGSGSTYRNIEDAQLRVAVKKAWSAGCVKRLPRMSLRHSGVPAKQMRRRP
jgi:hypothetical protein